MARLPLIDPAATSGDMRASFDRMPVVLNIFRMMAHAEANFIPAMRFANSILHRQKLSHVNRELLILQVAQRQHGVYEWRQHVPIALGVGVTQKQIDCIEQGKYEDAAFNAAEHGAAGVRPGSHRERARRRAGICCDAHSISASRRSSNRSWRSAST